MRRGLPAERIRLRFRSTRRRSHGATRSRTRSFPASREAGREPCRSASEGGARCPQAQGRAHRPARNRSGQGRSSLVATARCLSRAEAELSGRVSDALRGLVHPSGTYRGTTYPHPGSSSSGADRAPSGWSKSWSCRHRLRKRATRCSRAEGLDDQAWRALKMSSRSGTGRERGDEEGFAFLPPANVVETVRAALTPGGSWSRASERHFDAGTAAKCEKSEASEIKGTTEGGGSKLWKLLVGSWMFRRLRPRRGRSSCLCPA